MDKWSIGLMSGTSLDGIDAALIKSDGITISEFGPSTTIAYDDAFRERLRRVFGRTSRTDEITKIEEELTLRHGDAVVELLRVAQKQANDIEVVGFHGQTIMHDPLIGRTWQLGDGVLLANKLNIPVVFDFRTNDVLAGGEGAPLAPVYHQALAENLEKPIAFLNIGGVANITIVGDNDQMMAFDTGPGNALIDDLLLKYNGQKMDVDGAMAAAGVADQKVVDAFLNHPYFRQLPPKSLDRDDFSPNLVDHLTIEDGAATLTAMTIEAVRLGIEQMPLQPRKILVCGGGRHNPTMMYLLDQVFDVPVVPVEAKGWDGDGMEAQAFAFMALRNMKNLPISFPNTTNAPRPLEGGVIAFPKEVNV